MYLHLGQDKVIRYKEIIGIFDLDNTTVSKTTREMLRKAERSGDAVTIAGDLPKSYIVCSEEKGKQKVFISPVTPTTLQRRIRKKSL